MKRTQAVRLAARGEDRWVHMPRKGVRVSHMFLCGRVVVGVWVVISEATETDVRQDRSEEEGGEGEKVRRAGSRTGRRRGGALTTQHPIQAPRPIRLDAPTHTRYMLLQLLIRVRLRNVVVEVVLSDQGWLVGVWESRGRSRTLCNRADTQSEVVGRR